MTASASKTPSLFRNLVSLAGTAIVIAALISIIFLFLPELTTTHENPYIGIFPYIAFPGVLLFGLSIVLIGAIIERRRGRRQSPEAIGGCPGIGLRDRRRRRRLLAFAGVTVLFLLVSAFGSYRAYEYTESVAFCGQTC